MLVSIAYANWNYWATAGGEDEPVSHSHQSTSGCAKRAESGARGNRARAGRSRGKARRSIQAEEGNLRNYRVRGYRRLAERPREEFCFACAAARGGRAGTRGKAVRESGGAARGRVA